MAAWWEFWHFTNPSFWRWMRAKNTPDEEQMRLEHEAVTRYARAKYQARLRELCHAH